jgi:formylglycine-generating enzyme required for sulfatase activity
MSLTRNLVPFSFAGLLCLTLSFSPSFLVAQTKHALLVAVGKYELPDKLGTLKYPEADARAIQGILTREDGSGYQVTLLLGPDATRARILEELEKISKEGKAGGHLILGFFGHGVQFGADAYFCPYDTNVRQVVNADGQKEWIGNKPLLEPDPATMVPMREMLAAMDLSKAGSKLLLADCCRENPNGARGITSRAFGSELRLSDLPNNTAAFFACDRDELAYELDELGHGVFTKAFLDALANSERPTANELSVTVSRGVTNILASQNKTQTVKPLVSGVIDLGIINIVGPVGSGAPDMQRSGVAPTLTEPSAEIATIRNSIDLQLVPIPAGKFRMGSPTTEAGRYSDEPPREVTISRGFHMSVTEVTQSQYQAVMGSNPSIVRQPQHPVENVTWQEAVRFCEALSNRPEEKAAGRSYRLPTEAEWEYAARASQTTRFHFGDELERLSDFAWFKSNSDGNTPQAVKQKQPNAFGLYDMYGNVYEWCSDWYVKLPSGAATDPQGPTTGGERVMRGGSFRDDAKFLRSAARMSYPPQEAKAFCGFRVVMEER